MNRRVSLGDRFQYRVDTLFSKGGWPIFVGLAIVFLSILAVVILARGLLLALLPDTAVQHDGGVLRNLYIAFLVMTDPGNMVQDLSSSPWFKATAVVAGLAGLVMLSALIAFITTALDQRLARLKKGHSRVIESGHTLILGWSEQRAIEIIRELIIANESEHDSVVVVLADVDKEYMDDYLSLHLAARMSTRIVTRSGNPAAPINLDLVGVGDAKSVIVLSGVLETAPDDDKAAADARVIKALLAVVSTRPTDARLNISAEVLNPRLHGLARDISREEIITLDGSEILAKILVQTSRSIGLSVVYNEILSFDGAEMYFHEDTWGSVPFGSLAMRFLDGIPMGYQDGDHFTLNPDPRSEVPDGAQVLILATDDSTIEFSEAPIAVGRSVGVPARKTALRKERELVIGWTPKCPTILAEYSEYVVSGSRIDVMLRSPAPAFAESFRALDEELSELDLQLIDADPMEPETWDRVDPAQYNNILILSQATENNDTDRIDAETIMILLLLRRYIDESTAQNRTKLITELVESDNQALVMHAGVHDFVVSTKFISMLLAQISEEQAIHGVYDALFEEEGSEIYLKSISLYADSLPIDLTYADMIATAQERGEICLGVKIKEAETDPSRNYGIQLIPPKTQVFQLCDEDSLVVLAEDET